MLEGFTRISQASCRQRILYQRQSDFRAVHTQIFATVSAEAGRIRDEECIVQIFGSVCDNWDLDGEFALLNKQLSAMIAEARTARDKIVILAFTHARIVAMQPALFGNKRTAMCLALSQARALLREITTLHPFDTQAYYLGLEAFIKAGDSELLNRVFGQIFGISGPFSPAPFVARCGCYQADRWQMDPQGVLDSSRKRISAIVSKQRRSALLA